MKGRKRSNMKNEPKIIAPHFQANRAELLKKARLEKFPDILIEFDDFINKFASRLNPKAAFVQSKVSHIEKGSFFLSGIRFFSPVLSRFLSKGKTVFPFIATCGDELEDINLTDMDYMAPFWVDSLKETALQIATDSLKEQIRSQHNIEHLSAMSPGSADASVWDIREQKQLFSLFGDTKKLIGVSLTPSYLMVPNKTISGVLFSTTETISDCRFCTRTDCNHRQEECEHTFLVTP